MLLLLLMYLSPVVAAVLFWRSQSVAAGIGPDGDGPGAATAWHSVRSTVEGRLALARPVAGAFLVPAATIGATIGMSAAGAFLAGAAFAAFTAALTHSASLAAARSARMPTAGDDVSRLWPEASSIALGLAALAAGAIGTLAWFFADPAGVVVLGTFIGGSSAAALFLGMTANSCGRQGHAAASAKAGMLAREAAAWSVTSPMHAHLSAVAASLVMAATVEPEHLLALGGLLAETETLRSELLLLPVAVTVLSGVVTLMTRPIAATLLERRGRPAMFDVERIAALFAGVMVFGLVMICGLAWAVAGAFAIGLAARQLLVVPDETAIRARRAGRGIASGLPSLLPALTAAAALAAGHALAGWYGVTLSALGMTATYASSAASASLRGLCGYADAPADRPDNSDFLLADASATLAGTLALLVAATTVLTAGSTGPAAMATVAAAAPGLLIGTVVGAACAACWSARHANPGDDEHNIRSAAGAVAVAALLPALAGIGMGTGAAIGVALGFTAWAAASAPLAPDEESASEAHPRLRRSALLAWARTMALSAVVGATLVN